MLDNLVITIYDLIMVREYIKKEDYTPITKVNEGVYKLMFEYRPQVEAITERDDYGNIVNTGEVKETDYCTVLIHTFYGEPNRKDITKLLTDYYNKETDWKILSGFVWNDIPVWLSKENQFNYKAAYDMAIQTNGASMYDENGNYICTFKLGTDKEPVIYTFQNVEELADFYTKGLAHIQKCLQEGWALKAEINWEDYGL